MTDPFAVWRFRFRGKTRVLMAMVQCFLDEPAKGLHPSQIARGAGIPIYDVARRLNSTPELFVRLPGLRDGIVRYRLASSVAARGPEEIEALIARNARRETWLLYALVAIIFLILLVPVMVMVPTFL